MSKENLNKFVNSLQQGDAKQAGEDLKNSLAAVSYTHLTLPTICSV